ncbi:MAG: nucleotide sugar dehydrogenase [Bryobacteraceae bacterium]
MGYWTVESSGSPVNTTVAVFGLGYVGCVSAACFTRLGLNVIGVDRDQYKIDSVLAGRAPFYEPGLEEMVREGVASGRLSATVSVADAISRADVALLCVGTPSERNGNIGLDQLRRVSEDIAATLSGRTKPLVVAVRSTAFPGTCESVVAPCFIEHSLVSVVCNPEFLREGAAVADFLDPSLVVVGGTNPEAVARVADLYRPLGTKPCLVTLRAAEAIKYACNAFHAVKISFANEIGTLCENLGVPGHEVMETLCHDLRLNISPAYLKPGFAFGGSCLPKDLRALVYRASRLDLNLPMLEAVLPSNQEHLQRALHAVLDLPVERIGIYGLAFKENTDDLRESPVIGLIESLIGKGRELRIFDPHIRLDEIYGSNRAFVLNAIPHIGKLVVNNVDELLAWAQHIIVTQKLRPEAAAIISAANLPIMNLAGSPAHSIGRSAP